MSENTEVLTKVKADQQPANKLSLSEAAAENLRTGVLLMCKEALVTAIQDRRLHRGHLSVLATLVQFMSSRTAKAWPGRAAIAAVNGMPVKTVSNLLLELRNFNYLIAEREAVEEAGNRNLTVYTFGNIDHETIRREITKFVESVRVARSAEALRGEPEVPPQRDAQSPAPAGQSRPGGNSSPAPAGTLVEKVPPQRVEKSRPSGDSNSKKELEDRDTGERLCNSLGHGVTFDANAIKHRSFAISIAAVRMQAALDPSLPKVSIEDVCKATALQWAVAIEAGQLPHTVVPGNIVGAIIGGIRKGQYAKQEHAARVGKIAGKPKIGSRW